jgi:hypothetical protein
LFSGVPQGVLNELVEKSGCILEHKDIEIPPETLLGAPAFIPMAQPLSSLEAAADGNVVVSMQNTTTAISPIVPVRKVRFKVVIRRFTTAFSS